MNKKKNYITDEVETILHQATIISEGYNQNWCNTAHLFAAFMKFITEKSTIRTVLLQTENYSFFKYITDSEIRDDEIILKKNNNFYEILGENTNIPATETVKSFVKFDGKNEDPDYTKFANEFINLLIKYGINGINYKYVFQVTNPIVSEKTEDQITIEPDILDICKTLHQRYIDTKEIQTIYCLLEALFKELNETRMPPTKEYYMEVYDILAKASKYVRFSSYYHPNPDFEYFKDIP